MTPPKAMPHDVSKALAHRFRKARDEAWDNDRCDVEASAFLAELRQRGWSMNPDVDWRRLPPVSPAHPEVRDTALARIREQLRAARRMHTPDPTTSETTTGEPDVLSS